jgi:RNA 2',3'-cyclic 3'-phosphodiesterase
MLLRSFIAVNIPSEIQSAAARSIAPLQKTLTKPLVRWVPLNNVHLTLKFLGDVSPDNLARLAEALKVEVLNHETFTIDVGGLGAFPDPRRARILWIGLETSLALKALMRGVETVSTRLGYSSEDRPFSPHLTIGRVGQNVSATGFQSIRTAIEGINVGALGTIPVNALNIYKSDLLPGGSVYTNLYILPLKPSQEGL